MIEAVLQKQVLAHLHARGIFAWRMNTGGAQIKGQWVTFGLPGQADITGILPNGRRLEVELKGDRGHITAEQRIFGDRISSMGGLYIASKTLQGVMTAVEEAMR